MKSGSTFIVVAAAFLAVSCTGSDNGQAPGLVTQVTGGVAFGTGGNPALIDPNMVLTGGGLGTTGGITTTGGALGTGGMLDATGGMLVATGGDVSTTGGATTPMSSGGDASGCPAAPDGATDAAIQALEKVNSTRVAAGAGCDTMVVELNASSTNHCEYYATNGEGSMCTADPHGEVMGCTGFTGESPGDRMMAAGYNKFGGWSEIMAFENDPIKAIDSWLNSVWHRIPLVDPWTVEMGYGAATGCDTIDFGTGNSTAPDDTIVVYPYDGQVDVPTTFHGDYEGPMPPAPPTGWPSASPVSINAKSVSVTEHTLTIDGDSTPIEHVWLDTATVTDPNLKGFLNGVAFMYANSPFAANTTYRVTLVGTHSGGSFNLTWTFTTGAASNWF